MTVDMPKHMPTISKVSRRILDSRLSSLASDALTGAVALLAQDGKKTSLAELHRWCQERVDRADFSTEKRQAIRELAREVTQLALESVELTDDRLGHALRRNWPG